ncbi:MAG TPA: hypothetical protein VMM12_14310 [Longimicrobiales bacterium]|nr:hypothetical protein [Longimicrobiales bacterium]
MTTPPLVLALSVLASSLPQELPAPRFDGARLVPASLLELNPDRIPTAPLALDPSPAPAVPGAADARGRGLTWMQIAHRVGGALVGGWIGYVGAQVVRSDWDKQTNGTFHYQRYSWAAAGAVVGFVGSHVIRGTRSPRTAGPRLEVEPRDGSYLSMEEILSANVGSAYDLIYNARMHWLITRGANSVAEIAHGESHGDFVVTVTPGRDKIIVYMDDVRIGGVQDMHEIPADLLTSARFLNAREATLRFGGGHAHGVILLSTAVKH